MAKEAQEILSILDSCCESFTFPMLDNGYVYLATSRLSAFVSEDGWALVIEIFGFSPRGGYPDIHVHTFASRLHNRNPREDYINDEAYRLYLKSNPHNESRFFYPMDGDYIDHENGELVANSATHVLLRGKEISLPTVSQYRDFGIELLNPHRVHVFELCRFLAATQREDVLATENERRVSISPNMKQILQLEEWNHPDVVVGVRTSGSETYRQLAQVLARGDSSLYAPSQPPNNHWRNWPDSGTL